MERNHWNFNSMTIQFTLKVRFVNRKKWKQWSENETSVAFKFDANVLVELNSNSRECVDIPINQDIFHILLQKSDFFLFRTK